MNYMATCRTRTRRQGPHAFAPGFIRFFTKEAWAWRVYLLKKARLVGDLQHAREIGEEGVDGMLMREREREEKAWPAVELHGGQEEDEEEEEGIKKLRAVVAHVVGGGLVRELMVELCELMARPPMSTSKPFPRLKLR